MKKFKICLVLLIGLMILGGTAWAFDDDDHVKQAPNAKGDLIFFPWFLTASGGWETKLTVINTSPTYSTVAKVVIRSFNWSEELLDFLIYLSPNDVWTGYLRTGANGVYIYSDDDSILRRLPVSVAGVVADDFASKTNPLTQNLFAVTCDDDTNQKGYVEVIESTATNGLTKVTGTDKVAKTTIYQWYHGTTQPVIWPENILTGYQEFNKADTNMTALIRAEVYADWDNTSYLTTSAVSGITNPSRNTIGELEAAMAKSDVAMPYINSANGDVAVHIFNFPTKMSLNNSASKCDEYVAAGESPYFTLSEEKCEDFYPKIYDTMENTPTQTGSPFSGGDPTTYPTMCNEVEFIVTNFVDTLFREGWVRYNWKNTANLKTFEVFAHQSPAWNNTYTGTPVLPVVLYFKASGSMSQTAAAWTDGTVIENIVSGVGMTLNYYQYSQYPSAQ